MKNKSFLLILGYILIILVFGITSCQHDIIIPSDYYYKGPCNCPSDSITVIKDKPCSSDTVYFQNVILPLLQSSCGLTNQATSCHAINAGGEKRPLISYNTIMQSGYVVSGSASSSELYKKLLESDPQDRMPPSPLSALTSVQINLIKKWIDQGAKNNYCNSCDTTAFKFGLNIWPVIRDNCMGCHTGASASKGVLLTDYTQIKAIVNDGRLKNVMNAANGYKQMPPSGKLSSCKIIQINKWISNGSPND
jgi:hypothetical protein